MAKKEVTTNEATGVQTTKTSEDPAQITAQDSAQTDIGGASAPAPGASAQTEKAQTPPAQTESLRSRDYVAEIGGNFNIRNATMMFGKDAVKALDVYAKHAGNGLFTEDEYNSNIFGGLGGVNPSNKTTVEAINKELANLDK